MRKIKTQMNKLDNIWFCFKQDLYFSVGFCMVSKRGSPGICWMWQTLLSKTCLGWQSTAKSVTSLWLAYKNMKTISERNSMCTGEPRVRWKERKYVGPETPTNSEGFAVGTVWPSQGLECGNVNFTINWEEMGGGNPHLHHRGFLVCGCKMMRLNGILNQSQSRVPWLLLICSHELCVKSIVLSGCVVSCPPSSPYVVVNATTIIDTLSLHPFSPPFSPVGIHVWTSCPCP